MAVSINNNVSSQYSQVIQSVQNRRRIDEQQALDQQLPEQKQNSAQKVYEAGMDQKEYEQVYASAKQYLNSTDEKQYGVSAYNQVKNQASRDELQSMLGISVYA